MRIAKAKISIFTLTAALIFLPAIGAFAGKLSRGDEGKPVIDLQTNLKKLGYYSGKIDGRYGPKTFDAVLAFQKSKSKTGLKADGIYGDNTHAMLTADKAPNPTLSRNDKGDAVRTLQGALKIGIDGKFGPATEEAVKNFQSKNKITADGVVGPSTWAALGNP